jgi:hypothetical protein
VIFKGEIKMSLEKKGNGIVADVIIAKTEVLT